MTAAVSSHFLRFNLLNVSPGDLTDAKFRDLRGSKQFLDEWETYHDAVKKCKEKVRTWLDIRGNHGKKQITLFTLGVLYFENGDAVCVIGLLHPRLLHSE